MDNVSKCNASKSHQTTVIITEKDFKQYQKLMSEVETLQIKIGLIKGQTLLLLNHNGLCLPDKLVNDVENISNSLSQLIDKFNYINNLD